MLSVPVGGRSLISRSSRNRQGIVGGTCSDRHRLIAPRGFWRGNHRGNEHCSNPRMLVRMRVRMRVRPSRCLTDRALDVPRDERGFFRQIMPMAAPRRPTRHPQGERAPFVQAASVTPPLMPMVDRALRPSPLRTMASHAIVRAPLALLRSSPAVWRALEMSMSMSLREPPDT